MSVQIEKKEHNMATLTIEVPSEEFDKAMNQAYLKMRGQINVPGFRKGKAPRKMIEKLYGAAVFYEEAANIVIPDAYDNALKEVEEQETIVSRPQIDVTQVEEGKPFIFTAGVALKPPVTLGEYKGMEVPALTADVTDAEIDAEVERERENNSRMIDIDDRPVRNGDIIRLDYEGTVDGVPFDGGKAEDYPLTIGSGSFIPGFEDQLIGAQAGEALDVKVTFPEDYHEKSLAGKEAVFACKVNSIQMKELPEVDDEFAQDVSEFDTLNEYKADIRERLLKNKEAQLKRQKENAAVDKAVENAQMDIPEPMIQEQISRMQDEFARQLQSQGISPEQYMQMFGMDQSRLAEQMRPDAIKRIQNSLVLEAVADAENIEISEERFNEELAKMAESYRMQVEKLSELMGDYEKEQMKNDLRIQAAVDIIRDAAKEVEVKEEDKEQQEEA